MQKIITNKFIASVGVLGLVGSLVVSSVAFAANTATVAATVMVQNISLSVSDGTVAYGTLGANATKSTCGDELNDAQTITNDGNVAETFNIQGQNSANWTIGSAAASNVYVEKFATSTCPTAASFTGTPLTTSYATAAANVASGATTTLNLQINTPNPSTYFTSQSVDVLLQAVAY